MSDFADKLRVCVVVGAAAVAIPSWASADDKRDRNLLTLTTQQLDTVTAAGGLLSTSNAASYAVGNRALSDAITAAQTRTRLASGLGAATSIADDVASSTATTTLAIDDDPNDLLTSGTADGVAAGQAITIARTSGFVFDGKRVNIGVIRSVAYASGSEFYTTDTQTSAAANGDVVRVSTIDGAATGENFELTWSRTVIVSLDPSLASSAWRR